MSDAPANDGGPAWESVSDSLRSLQAILTFGSQGQNAATAVQDAIRRNVGSTSLHGQLRRELGIEAMETGFAAAVAAAGGPPPKPPPPPSKNPVPSGPGGTNPVPVEPPKDRPGGNDQCCCKAADIFVDGQTVQSGSVYSSKVVVTLDVNQDKGKPKGCSLEWEELPSSTYGPKINGKDVGPPVPGGVYSNLTSHPVFQKMAKTALDELTAVCPVSITPFTDTPSMGITGRLVIRITLKSGCDDTSVTVYVVLTAPTYADSSAVTNPVVVKSGDPDFKKLEDEYKKTPKAPAK